MRDCVSCNSPVTLRGLACKSCGAFYHTACALATPHTRRNLIPGIPVLCPRCHEILCLAVVLGEHWIMILNASNGISRCIPSVNRQLFAAGSAARALPPAFAKGIDGRARSSSLSCKVQHLEAEINRCKRINARLLKARKEQMKTRGSMARELEELRNKVQQPWDIYVFMVPGERKHGTQSFHY